MDKVFPHIIITIASAVLLLFLLVALNNTEDKRPVIVSVVADIERLGTKDASYDWSVVKTKGNCSYIPLDFSRIKSDGNHDYPAQHIDDILLIVNAFEEKYSNLEVKFWYIEKEQKAQLVNGVIYGIWVYHKPKEN